ncbi:MAG: type II secretion system F family protein [Bacillota bacterium]|nr:type II secretion system F family protein [Bacillota bacterium]
MFGKNQRTKKLLSHDELSVFFRELALLFESGIALSEALFIMAENAGSEKKKQLCTEIGTSLDRGNPLTNALAACGRFPSHSLQLVDIGQTSGKLDAVLDSLSIYYGRQASLQKMVKSVLTYPLVMIAIMFCVLTVLIIEVLPLFGQVFRETGAQMPLFLRLVTDSNAFSAGLICVLLLIFLLLIAVFVSAGRGLTSGQYSGSFVFKLPFMKGLVKKMEAGNFAYGMALLLAGGVSLDRSLDLCGDLVSDRAKAKIAEISCAMEGGETFSGAVIKSEFLDGTFPALLAAGEKAGHTDEMMDLIADRYTDEINDKISSVLSVIEPTLVIVMSLIIGGILLSIMVPLMNIMTSV